LEKFAASLGDGTAYATKIFARMARLSFSVQPTKVFTVEHAAPPADLFPAEKVQAGIVPLSGDLFGQALLVFPSDAAAEISRAMAVAANVSAGETAAFEEAVNIYANTALAAITRDFRLSVYPAPPRVSKISGSALWRAFLDPLNQPEGRSTIAAVDINSSDRRLAGKFLLALRQDSMQNVRWKAVAGADKRVDVKMGDLSVSSAPGILKVTSLGSCLAVILYDSGSKLGAIAHVMLPACTAADLGRARPGKYADTAVDALLKSFPATPPSRLKVWLIGGASMFSVEGSPAMQIGRRNVEVTKQKLQAAGLKDFAEDTGGTSGRTVELDTSNGEVSIHGAGGVKRVIAPGSKNVLPSTRIPPPTAPPKPR
jgi:chemotaxis protein CheD